MVQSIYSFSRSGIQALDQAAIGEFHIPGVVLMENAARAAANEAIRMCRQDSCNLVLVLCGKGNNGGDGLALARLVHNAGLRVAIATVFDPDEDTTSAETQAHIRIVRAMELPWYQFDADGFAGLVEKLSEEINSHEGAVDDDAKGVILVDALLGTGLASAPRSPIDQVIDWTNRHRTTGHAKRVLAIDVPSGLDCETGLPLGSAAVRADVTVTFVGLKQGFVEPGAQPYLGELVIGDIGAPRELRDRFGAILSDESLRAVTIRSKDVHIARA